MSGVKGILPPPFEWVEIPAGRVELVDSHGAFEVPAFLIAKYPITNAQYAKFVEAGGYHEKKWWTTAGWEAREKGKWTEPRYWKDKKWNRAKYPVVGVSWYEAVALCRWLSEVSGEPVMLRRSSSGSEQRRGMTNSSIPGGMTGMARAVTIQWIRTTATRQHWSRCIQKGPVRLG